MNNLFEIPSVMFLEAAADPTAPSVEFMTMAEQPKDTVSDFGKVSGGAQDALKERFKHNS